MDVFRDTVHCVHHHVYVLEYAHVCIETFAGTPDSPVRTRVLEYQLLSTRVRTRVHGSRVLQYEYSSTYSE